MSACESVPHAPFAVSAEPAAVESGAAAGGDCIRCGLCLESCPTYIELGLEPHSPRGRIAVMRAVRAGRLDADADALRPLDGCLDCRACETACPSGVHYGGLIESMRAELAPRRAAGRTAPERLRDAVLFGVLPHRARLRPLLAGWRMAEALGLPAHLEQLGLAAALGLPALPRLPPVPRVEPLRESYESLPGAPAADAPIRRAEPAGAAAAAGRAAMLFVGCVGEALTPQVNRAAIRVLTRHGCDLDCPRRQVCCGAIHHHAGYAEAARRFARRNVAAFGGGDRPIVSTAAGCGAMLKHYGALLADDAALAGAAARFAARVRDVSEHLAGLPPAPGIRSLPRRVAYHDPCHLCHAQGVRRQPRDMLRRIPGLELTSPDESEICCGAAGTYSLMQPAMSARLAARKWSRLRAARPQIVATGNVGCIVQLWQHAPHDLAAIPVMHPIELLDEAYGSDAVCPA